MRGTGAEARRGRDLRGRAARILLAATVLQTATLACAPPAAAFKLFGMTLFADKSAKETIINPLNYSVTLTAPGADKALLKKLRSASMLLADRKRPVSGAIGLLTKARNDREILIATLYEEARYDAVVDITIAGRPLDSIPPDVEFDRRKPVPVAITVRLGEVYRLGKVTLVGAAAGLDPAKYGLVTGGDAGSQRVLKAEKDIVLALKKKGHPFARVTNRQIVADHATARLDVRLTVATGPVAPFGDIRVTGTRAVKNDFVAYMADIRRGRIYSPDVIKDARNRLLALDVFDSVRVAPTKKLAPDGSLPVDIMVSEKKPHFLGLGATLSNTDGAGLEGYWGHRNLFGHAERLRLDASVSGLAARRLADLDYDAKLGFTRPGVLNPASKFTADVNVGFNHPDAYDQFVVGGDVGLSYALDKHQTASGGLSLEWSRIDDAFGTTRHLLLSAPLEYDFDNRDDKFNPTKGFHVVLDAEPDHDFRNAASYLRIKGQASTYRALGKDDRVVVAGRIAAGSILGASLPTIAADKRYYVGGGGSVRGYAYQGIGPVNSSGTPTGGRSFLETSLELRVKMTDKVGIVPFIDGGSDSASQVPTFSGMRFGAGVGLRYMTGFGPLRIDAAIPLNRRPGGDTFGLYAGIGQAF